jgi:hypothetical protein
MSVHKDALVQVTHDVQLRRGVLIPRGTTGRIISKITLHRACIVEFTIDRQTVVARVDDHDLAEVRPNARV